MDGGDDPAFSVCRDRISLALGIWQYCAAYGWCITTKKFLESGLKDTEEGSALIVVLQAYIFGR